MYRTDEPHESLPSLVGGCCWGLDMGGWVTESAAVCLTTSAIVRGQAGVGLAGLEEVEGGEGVWKQGAVFISSMSVFIDLWFTVIALICCFCCS